MLYKRGRLHSLSQRLSDSGVPAFVLHKNLPKDESCIYFLGRSDVMAK